MTVVQIPFRVDTVDHGKCMGDVDRHMHLGMKPPKARWRLYSLVWPRGLDLCEPCYRVLFATDERTGATQGGQRKA
jgi:hypothetical protein